MSQYGDYLGYAVVSGNPGLLKQAEPQLALAERNYYSLVGMSKVLMQYGTHQAHWTQLKGWLEKAGRLQDDALPKNLLSFFLYLKGFLYAKLEQRDAAIALFRESYAVYPYPDNGSVDVLRQLGVSLTP